ncbi:hypothetical protein Ocin01_07702, partial [Orchesella cincta]
LKCAKSIEESLSQLTIFHERNYCERKDVKCLTVSDCVHRPFKGSRNRNVLTRINVLPATNFIAEIEEPKQAPIEAHVYGVFMSEQN